MLSIQSSGSWKGTYSFLDRCASDDILDPAVIFAEEGVQRLRDTTPQETGITASMWSYEIEEKDGQLIIWFKNDHVVDGFNVAVGLQYGHGTGTGGWVEGYDYINPALRSVFDKMVDGVWKEVTKA